MSSVCLSLKISIHGESILERLGGWLLLRLVVDLFSDMAEVLFVIELLLLF